MSNTFRYARLGSIFTAFLFTCIVGCNTRDNQLQGKAKFLIEQIENYESEFGEVPASLEDLDNVEESIELHYRKMDSQNFIIWYGTTLGESMIYYSDSEKWEDGYREITQE